MWKAIRWRLVTWWAQRRIRRAVRGLAVALALATTAGANIGTWRAKAVVLDVREVEGEPPVEVVLIVDEPCASERAATLKARAWCADGVTLPAADEGQPGVRVFPAHRVLRCESYVAR